jgi:hypothetical protein
MPATRRMRAVIRGRVMTAALCAACLIATMPGTALTAQVAAERISAPPTRIGFSYELESILDWNGVYINRYNMYQSADGSLRRDAIEPDGTVGYIDIVNVPLQKYYERVRGRWTEYQMRPGANSPPTVLVNDSVKQVPATDTRVAALSNVPLPLSFYEVPFAGPGTGVIYCPELHMLRVWQGYAGGNHQFTVRSVQLGEPQVSFIPPAGAQVAVVNSPNGPGRISAADPVR